MSSESNSAFLAIFEEAIAAHRRFAADRLDTLREAADAIAGAVRSGHKVLAFGNGGSAGDAQHLVAELVGRFERERQALPAIALSADITVLTAIGNDYGYERVFARQVEALGSTGDVAVGISTSGRSPNVVAAMQAARARHLVTIALTGHDGGPVGLSADIHVNVAETSTARIQEVHRTLLHAMCSSIERQFETPSAQP